MTHKNSQRLAAAANLLDDVIASLDVRAEPCPTCSMTRYANWGDHNKAKEMRAVVVKLRRFAGATQEG